MWALLLMATVVLPVNAAATSPTQEQDGVEQGPLTVYLVTAGPGDAVWERFGHNALWIHDARTGQDIWWNWGLFSFSQEGFITRLIRGEMLYSMGGRPMQAELAQYRAQGRSVWAQQLALTQQQAARLDRFVRRNSMPANRDYIYDYYEDNCSTRVRDAIDGALGGVLRAHFEPMAAGTTWREQTRRHVEVSPWTDTGIALVLGRPGDEPISVWQQMFLPLELRHHLGSLLIESPDGTMQPLVVRELDLVKSERELPPVRAASRVPAALALGGGLGFVILILGGFAGLRVAGTERRTLASARISALALLAGLGVLHLAAGLIGGVLVGSWFTDHDFWRPNENLLQAGPLSLLLAIVLFGALLRPQLEPLAAKGARWIAAIAAFGLLLKAWPGPDQGNFEVLALTLPVHLASAWALSRAARPVPPETLNVG